MNPHRTPWFTLGPYPTVSCWEPFSPTLYSISGQLNDANIFAEADDDDVPSWETPWIDIGGEG